MPELSVEAIFGTGTTQTATTFTVSKSGLAAILTAAGYTFNPKADNSADELMAALICAGLVNLSPANREVDPINRNIELSYDSTINFDTTTLNGQTYNRHTVSVNFYKPIATPKLNPSDF